MQDAMYTNPAPNAQDRPPGDGEVQVSLHELAQFINTLVTRLKVYWLVFFVLLCLFFVGSLLSYIFGQPIYVASAVVGPPNPSPTASLLSSMGSGSGGVRRLLGNSGGSGNDPYSEYQQLLKSPRLTVELVNKDGILQILFPKQWDAATNSWRKPSALHDTLSSVKRFLQRPVSDHPGVEELGLYLAKNFSVEQAKSVGGSAISSFTNAGNNYLALSVASDSAEKSKLILTKLLSRADRIIRDEQHQDVEARIAFINSELPKVTQTEQRNALIETLASQEELKVMMVSDVRFAYVLVSTPYASPIPISPAPPGKAVLYSLMLSLFLWIVLVLFEPRIRLLQMAMAPLKRG